MEHNTCRENLSAYLDGELPAEEKLSVESHLALCPVCSRQLEELKLVSVVLKRHVMQPVPAALKEAVFAEKPAAPFFSGWLKPVAVLSAAAAGLLIILALPRSRNPERIMSPALFSSTQGLGGAGVAADKSAGPAGIFSSGLAGGQGSSLDKFTGAGAKSFAVPAFNRKGAYGQAKFAGSGNSGGKVSAIAPAASMFRGAGGAAAAGSAGYKGELSMRAMTAKSGARPEWVSTLIQRYQAGPEGNPPFAIWQYSYKGNKVYYLPPQCCGQYSELHDGKGALLCAPDGGKNGLGDGKCADFNRLRTDGELIWQDTRGQ